MKRLIIGKSYMREENNKVRLCTDINREGIEFHLFYEFDAKYGRYINTEVADPFLTAILPYAMEFEYDIECESNISEDIYFNLCNDFIPVLSKSQSYFHSVKIEGGVSRHEHISGKAVGTGVSMGVDSIYTILSHLPNSSNVPKSYGLTHLVLMNAGSCSWVGGEESYKWFMEEVRTAEKVCERYNLEMLTIHTNLMEFYGADHSHSGTLRMSGCVLALDKLFGKYYLASGYDLKNFGFANDDAK